jgi:hypothetical protein
MFRSGAYITQNLPAKANILFVSDLSRFQSGDLVRLIHAPRLQSTPLAPLSELPITELFYSEDHVVDVVTTTTVLPDGTSLGPHLQLRLGDTLGAPFGLDTSFTGDDPSATPVPYLRDGVGVVSAGFYEPDLALVADAYEATYVEVVAAGNTAPEIPFQTYAPLPLSNYIANKWFENGKRTPSADVTPDPNHGQIAGGTRHDNPFTTSPTAGAELGYTPYGGGHHRSWVWVGRIELAVTQPPQNVFTLSAQALNAEVTLHETVHQLRVNTVPPANVQVGHCLKERYQMDGKYCHMHAPFYDLAHNGELGDGAADFHYEVDAGGNVDSEYIHIRRHAEPFVK